MFAKQQKPITSVITLVRTHLSQSELADPFAIQIGDNAHLWIDIAANQASYGRRASVNANLFLVEREHGKDRQIQEGVLRPKTLTYFVQELLRVRDELTSRQAFIGANGAYEKQIEEWIEQS